MSLGPSITCTTSLGSACWNSSNPSRWKGLLRRDRKVGRAVSVPVIYSLEGRVMIQHRLRRSAGLARSAFQVFIFSKFTHSIGRRAHIQALRTAGRSSDYFLSFTFATASSECPLTPSNLPPSPPCPQWFKVWANPMAQAPCPAIQASSVNPDPVQRVSRRSRVPCGAA